MKVVDLSIPTTSGHIARRSSSAQPKCLGSGDDVTTVLQRGIQRQSVPALLWPTPAGTVLSPLELETWPPLGVGQEWDDRSTLLPADAVLFLYTDGLVETRADDMDEGVRRLGELLEGLPLDARTALDNALELHPGEDQDDVAVLVAHVP
jgi:Stage II sporulation protein E (SpoIIE)